MTDELTPEEKEAIDKLPRERMPAGLEARVVGAMRDRGFLARRRRTIEITNGRIAGLLAACVAVIIGAYAIGLHRGDGSRILPPAETATTYDRGRTDMPPVATREEKAKSPATDAAGTEELEMAGRAQETKRERDASAVPEASNSDEADADRLARNEAPMKDTATGGSGVAESVAPESPAAAFEKSAPRAPAVQGLSAPAPSRTLTFFLNGTPVLVEAPDSVRVTQDERGRMLLIYTSDGVIRIRLADEP